jgi:hypothetical protein
MITANGLLVWFVEGLFMGLGFCVAACIVYYPTRRWF